MIPISTFNLLVAVDIAFILYSVIDYENRLYANIVAAFIAAILSGFLGTIISTETVYDELSCTIHFINSLSIGLFLGFISFVMFVYTIYMLWGAYEENKAYKAMIREREE